MEADFVRCATLLASPATEPAVRAQADSWLTALRQKPAAWSVALGVLRASGDAASPPEVRLQAASLLAWKARRQLEQLQPVERQVELAEALVALLAAPPPQAGGQDAAARGLAAALANLAIRCPGWQRPLDTLGSRLSQERLVEFLTLLPEEISDAVAAAAAAPAEVGWALKAQAADWAPGVAAWLHGVHASCCAAAGGGGPGGAAAVPAGVLGSAAWQAGTLAVLRCFAAWVRCGCLEAMDACHSTYFARLAGELLFVADPASRLPYHPALLPAAVDAASELVEHASQGLQPLLLQLAVALPARAAALHGGPGADGETVAAELAHVFANFCSTQCTLCAAEGPGGDALRQGLLQLLSLPSEPGSEMGGAALPAMGALSDLLEHLVVLRDGHGSEEGEEAGGGRPLGPEAVRAFAAAALDVLLVRLQPFPSAFEAAGGDAGGRALVERGAHSPEGVPDALRKEADQAIDHLGDLLGIDAVLARLGLHAEGALVAHGARSAPAQAALDACLLVLKNLGCLLEAAYSERSKSDPPPQWLGGVVRLFSLLPEVEGSAGAACWASIASAAGEGAPPLTILHSTLLSCFATLGHVAMPLLQATPQQHQGLQQLVLLLALRALSGCRRSADVAVGSTEDVVEEAAVALRMLCSCSTASGVPASAELLAGVQQGMALLQQPARFSQYQDAHSQLVNGLVHVLHGIPPGDAQLRSMAEAAVQRSVLDPLTAALQGVAALGAGAASPGGGPPGAQQQAAALWRLHAALRQVQSLLNGLESYSLYEGGGSDAGGSTCSGGGGAAGQEVARGVAAAAVAALLACWPQLSEVCAWRCVGGVALAPPRGAAGLQRELYSEVAHCLASSISLEAEAFRAVLPSFVDTAAACFFLPGASALNRPLIQALETYGSQAQYQRPLLASVAGVMGAPGGRQLAALRGGDADPAAAAALLSLLGCCLRQACQWRQLGAGCGEQMEALLSLGLPLAVGNAACHHKDTSLLAVGTLSALLALLLQRDSPLQPGLLRFAAQHGGVLLQGLLLALLSLNSGSHLPKVVSLMSDAALLAATLALMQQQQQQQQGGCSSGMVWSPDAVCAAAGAQLAGWLGEMRARVMGSGLLTEEAMAALLAQWDWQPTLQAAALQLAAPQHRNSSGGPNAAELRRAQQRVVRQVSDLVRGRGFTLAAA